MATTRGATYLLHLVRLISPAHTCQHSLGWAADLEARLTEHARGGGARLTQVALERGIGWELMRTWADETHSDERRLKGARGRRL